jgi:biopolymer transport protein ExbD
MALRKFSKSHHGTMHELNITPLLDLAFVLLVIFIITTAPMVNDLDLNLPTRQAKPQGPAARPSLILVEADGRIYLNQREVAVAALRQELQRLKQQNPDTAVVVHGEDVVVYQTMVDVFDALQRAEITKVGLATERPSEETLNRL